MAGAAAASEATARIVSLLFERGVYDMLLTHYGAASPSIVRVQTPEAFAAN